MGFKTSYVNIQFTNHKGQFLFIKMLRLSSVIIAIMNSDLSVGELRKRNPMKTTVSLIVVHTCDLR